MRIACPSCNAAYDIPDDRLAPGRVVRCARCSADWVPLSPPQAVLAPTPPPASRPSLAPTPPIVVQRVEPTPEATGHAALALAWLVSFAVLGAAGWAAYTYRADIKRTWPPSERAYMALGLQD